MPKESNSNSLFDLLLKNEKNSADRVYLRQPKNGVWHEYTWSSVMLQARKVAGFLHHLGLKKAIIFPLSQRIARNGLSQILEFILLAWSMFHYLPIKMRKARIMF